MVNTISRATRSKIRVIKKIKSLHTVVEKIALNLAEIDLIQYITISGDFL